MDTYIYKLWTITEFTIIWLINDFDCPTMNKKPGPDISDAILLAEAFQNVTPLPGRKIIRKKRGVAKRSVKASSAVCSSTVNKKTPAASKKIYGTLIPGQIDGIDSSLARKFKRGKVPIEKTLDMHGLKQKEAEKSLSDFVNFSFNSNLRCVLVITGKGSGLEGGGVLKKMTPLWLNSPLNREKILSFTEAKQSDGGGGALYVLLRKNKK